jgi:nitric oxide reductase NorQ protein
MLSTSVAITVIREGKFMNAYQGGKNVTKLVPQPLRRKALNKGMDIMFHGKDEFSLIAPNAKVHVAAPKVAAPAEVEAPVEAHEMDFNVTDIPNPVEFIHSSPDIKPKDLIMSDLKWKYLVRTALRGKNIMMTGPSGSGKTVAARYLAQVLKRPDFYFNLGATQDPRATLIGNTHFSKDSGTYFSESLFVKAIQTENANILLDELSRAHPEAWNILMTVLDPGQRYLRLDEKDGAPTIKVAKGVTFIATANIGNEYTATRVIDRAMMDRFSIIEMDQLDTNQESALLQIKFPAVPVERLNAIAEIADQTRKEVRQSVPKLTTTISTRASVEIASLLADGFSLAESAEVCIYPFFSNDGGAESERTFVKQIVQKYCTAEGTNANDPFGVGEEAKKAEFPF